MKILLINPPAFNREGFIREGRCTQRSNFWATLWPPITLAYMGAILENEGHEVAIVDSAAEGLSTDTAIKIIDKFKPDIYVSSSSTPTIYSDLAFVKRVKDSLSKTRTIIFGVHASVFAKECMQNCVQLDFVISGEPENIIDRLVKAISGHMSFGGIPGLAYRKNDGTLVIDNPHEFISDLDQLPFPAWHLIKRDRYLLPLKGLPFLLVLPSRGCPYSCTFCTTQKYYGSKPRFRSVDKVIDEIEYSRNQFDIKHFFFWSETFTFNKRYVMGLCDEMRRRDLDISWTCNSRVDIVDNELLNVMASSGCWMMSFGIESASQKILDNVKKGTKVEEAARAVKLAKNVGMSVVGHFIFGLPGENEDTIEETIKFSKALKLDFAQYYCACPFPGSELYSIASKEGWLVEDDFSKFNQDVPVLTIPTVSQSAVLNGKARAYRQFYVNPACFLRTLRHINFTNIGNISRLAQQAMDFLSMQKI